MSVHHARKNMKDKNRFSVLLKHLTSMANLKTMRSPNLCSTTSLISVSGSAENYFLLTRTMS